MMVFAGGRGQVLILLALTGFTGTKVQILTQEMLPAPRYSLHWLYWYKSTNTDAGDAPRAQVLIIVALLAQKYKY